LTYIQLGVASESELANKGDQSTIAKGFEIMSKLYMGVALLIASGLSTSANASVVLDLTLTATSDSDMTPLSTYNGTGTITLSSAPPASGLTMPVSAAVTFTIDGENFSGTAANVEFLNGNFYNAQFSEQIGPSTARFDLQTSGVYAFYYDNESQSAGGTISLSTTPLPAALPLFAGGLGLVGYLTRRRKQSAKHALAFA
jgi:hypothetical protein